MSDIFSPLTHSMQPIICPPHLRDNEKRREMLYKHLLILRNREKTNPELKNNVQALEKALPDLLADPPLWVGIGGDGQIFCSESEVKVVKLLRANSPPTWVRIQL